MQRHYNGVPIIGVVAPSGTGKTTLLRGLIPHLVRAGLRVGCIKHTHHPFEVDQPGKDSYLLRAAGAEQMLIGSADRWALMVETSNSNDDSLDVFVSRLDLANLDLVLVEGFRLEDIPKIEVRRGHAEVLQSARDIRHVIAIASDSPASETAGVPVLNIDDLAALSAFVLEYLAREDGLKPPAGIG